MSVKDLGLVTAYGYAVEGGYTGTEEEFKALLGNVASDLAEIESISASATTLPAGSSATASYNSGAISLGIPSGYTGNGIASVTLLSTSGAEKTYRMTFTDGTHFDFVVTDGEVTDDSLAETLEDYAKVDGYYDEMTVGTAEQLISSATIEDDDLYVFRSAGGTNDIGNRETDMLVGGTVAWNQLANLAGGSKTTNGITATFDSTTGIVELSGTATNTYASVLDNLKTTIDRKYFASAVVVANPNSLSFTFGTLNTTARCTLGTSAIAKANDTTNANVGLVSLVNGTDYTGIKFKPTIIDLTAMFGTEIADYIYSLEQANANDGVAWFRKYFPKLYYAYNAGSLQSVNVASHDLTGFNQWDEVWELGRYDTTTGNPVSATDRIRGKNRIEILPSTDYCFAGGSSIVYWYDASDTFISYATPSTSDMVRKSPANARYVRFNMASSYGTTYKGDICINRVWTGYRNGEYEEYVKHSYPYDESVQLRGIPQLVDGELKYDGDTYESSGKVTRKYGIVDLGTLNWSNTGSGDSMYFYAVISDKRILNTTDIPCNLVCDKFSVVPIVGSSSLLTNKSIMEGKNASPVVLVRDLSYTTIPEFKASVSGAYLVYELATPTEETADPFTNPQICDDFGTEEYVDAGVKNNTRDVAIPVGHVTQYMANLRDKLQHLPSLASSDGDYIIGQSGTSMSLKPIAPYFNAEHPNLTAGSANQLLSTITIEDQTPYKFRTSGGSVDIGDRETDMIVGGTIAWNQLIEANMSNGTNEHATYSVSNDEITITSDTSVAAVKGRFRALTTNHVYLGSCYVKSDGTTEVGSGFRGDGGISVTTPASETLWSVPTSYVYQERIGKATSGSIRFGIMVRNNTESGGYGMYKNVTCIDLTQMLGSTVADYIYGLETATAGAGVSFFRSLFPNMDAEYTYTDASDVEHTQKLRDYQTGVLLSVSGLQSHDMRGFNAWDEEWELGYYNVSTGGKISSTQQIRCKNKIPIIPNTSYYCTSPKGVWALFFDADDNLIEGYSATATVANNASLIGSKIFTTPPNGHSMVMYMVQDYGTTYNHDICINLSWDGERDGEYEPYTINSYALDDSLTLRGKPKLDASNNLYYDGDTYESDGTVTRKYGVVDLGSLNWGIDGSYEVTRFFSLGLNGLIKSPLTAYEYPNVITPKYRLIKQAESYSQDKTISITTGNRIYIMDSAYTDSASFKTAMSGVYLVYELATPTTESAEPYTNPQIVDDFGTEEYVTDSIVPVGHVTQYQPNLRAKLEMAPNSPDGDGDYVVKQTNGENEYVTLASTTTIQSILARLEALEGGN